jgi:hypothetical protein
LIAPNRTTVRPARTRRSRIERQYPHQESTGKSPDRERKIASLNKCRGARARREFYENESAILRADPPEIMSNQKAS